MLMKQPNLSYVTLLKGYIDLNGGSQRINTQVRHIKQNQKKKIKKDKAKKR